MPNAGVTFLGRLLLSAIFLVAGAFKLIEPAGTAGYFDSLGMPAPLLVAVVVGLFEVLAGLAIVIGLKTRLVAVALALFCIVSGFLGHFDPENQVQMQAFMKNIAIAGGFLVLAACGPGKWSIDARQV